MRDPNPTLLRLFMVLAAGIAASCGGSYSGDGDGGGGAATLNISIDPDTVTLGESATITWNSNGNSCTASGDWSGSKPGSGNESVTPGAAGTFTYRMTCRGGGYGESRQGSVMLTVEPPAQAAAWIGEGCCIDARAFAITGLTNAAGEHRFLARGRHYVGKPGASREVFASCDDCLVGTKREHGEDFELGSIALQGRAGTVASLEGHYLTQVSSGYALTVGIDAAGVLTGLDTRGCRLDGRISAPARITAVFTVTLEVSACGAGDGQYAGNAALLSGIDGGLLLLASNRKSAIGWRLGR